MMRLVDADEILEKKVFRDNRDSDYFYDYGITKAACEIIDAPTIEAIPIEYLKKKYDRELIESIISDWNEEQRRNQNDS